MNFLSNKLRMSSVALLGAGALAFVACGGDDDGGSSGPTGTDEEYVTHVCNSTNDFVEELFPVMLGAMEEGENEEEAMREAIEAMKGVLGDYRDDLADAPAPSDVREHHNTLLEQLDTAIDSLDPEDPEALDNVDFGDEEVFPEDIQERLSAVAADIEACAESGFFEDGF